MKYFLPALVLLILLSGCMPTGRAYSYLQYHNIHLQISPMTMTINTGSGAVDARKYMNAAKYAGEYELGDVRVLYPEGAEAAAKEVAQAFTGTSELVRKRLGINWSFKLELKLVRIPDNISSLHYSANLRRNRKLIFPIFINSKYEVRADWAPTVAHEVTEASMLAPKDRHKLVLGDMYVGDFGIGMGTRWFRDGVSNRAADLLGEQLFPGSYAASFASYSRLNAARDKIIDWSNIGNSPDYYAASTALIYEAENAAGEDAISKVMANVAREHVHGGRGLRRAFGQATGLQLPDYLRNYATPWLGIAHVNTKPNKENPLLMLSGNEVAIIRVYEATPASRWKLQCGDVVESVSGVKVRSSSQLNHEIAKHHAGEAIELQIRRDSVVHVVRIKLISMPQDISEFNRLSQYVPGTLSGAKK